MSEDTPKSTAEPITAIPFTDFIDNQGKTLFPLEPVNGKHSCMMNQGKLSEAIRRVLIYANPSKVRTKDCLHELVKILNAFGIESLIYSKFEPSRACLIEYVAQALNIPLQAKSQEYYGEHPEEPFIGLNGQEIFDLVITVGGDGTVLKYLSYSPFREIPILPINTGSLGYITSISFCNIEESMRTIFSGTYAYSSRILLKARLLDRYQNPKHFREHFALNEIAISACRAGLLADMELQVGSSSIRLQGDGIIVATPTGSTAYSLAAGGPIVDSEMEAVIITPVSPFSLATRPVVIPSNVRLFVCNAASGRNAIVQKKPPKIPQPIDFRNLDSSEAPLSVAIDGWGLGDLYPGESIYITGSHEHIQFLVIPAHNSYFENIRTKLGWHSVAHHRPQMPNK